MGAEQLEARRLLAVVINEFHYDSGSPLELTEFVELHNTGAERVDLSGWRLDRGVDYTFPTGASIAAGGYLVVAQSAEHFQTRFGFTPAGVWEAGDKLSNEGETIELLDRAGTRVDAVTYQLGWPWPTSGELGSSVELVNPLLDNDLAGSWRSSGLTGAVPAGTVLVRQAGNWLYRKGITANPPTSATDPTRDWRQTAFETATDAVPWPAGAAPIGYGDGDDATVLTDMRNRYTSFYARANFTVGGSAPEALLLRMYVDDGAIVWINGIEVARFHTTAGQKNFNSTSGMGHEASWEEVRLTNTGTYLVPGVNTIAVHVLNQSVSSSDLSFDLELKVPADTPTPGSQPGPPTPGSRNSVFAANAPPQLRQLTQSVRQPAPGQDVVISIKATDPDGVRNVGLAYQLVAPGDYIAIDDPRYATEWTTVPMADDGTGGDALAGDGVFTVTLPSSLQTNRSLVRYRVTATDSLGLSITGPYADDPQPNFAYYVYGETPAWSGAVRPGATPAVTYGPDVLDSIATYQLITTRESHVESQHLPGATMPGYEGSDYLWHGALVYDGVVYDHIRYRARGGIWRYAMGKNMWKFDFNRGHGFQARDDYGQAYEIPWDKLNLGAVIQQADFSYRGEQGLFESVGHKLFNLAGVAASNTNFVHFRIVASEAESATDQYATDFQGLYLAVEQLDDQFLEQHGLPDGNLYKMEWGTGVDGIGGDLNNQGDYPQPGDSSDLIAFKRTYESGTMPAAWWKENLDLDNYFSYRSIVEAIHHYDISHGKNYFYYHNPETDLWEMVPWDLDLTWADSMYGEGNDPFRDRVLTIPEFGIAYRNRLRELRDLLFNVEQVGLLTAEMAQFIYTPGEPSFVDADRAMWDYNPIMASSSVVPWKAGTGRYYAGGGNAPAFGSFAAMLEVLTDYTQARGHYIDGKLITPAEDARAPKTPVLSYAGAAGHPVDGLVFRTSGYQDLQLNPFAAMEWRVGEIANPATAGFDPTQPWKYEIDAVWESGELTSFTDSITVPAGVLEAGKTYRARVRMQDSTRRWSHWSDPLEFTTATVGPPPLLRISEIHYNPASTPLVADEEDLEFVEIVNAGDTPAALAGVSLTTFANSPYVFSEGRLGPGERIVVARNPVAFRMIYGSDANLAREGYGTANLANGGETIALVDAAGRTLQTVTWTDDPPWPVVADGGGPSLEIVDPLGDGSDPANWRASGVAGGTPGGFAPIAVGAGAQIVHRGGLSGDVTLVKQGTGRLVLDGASTHAGGLIVAAGEVVVRNAAALGSGPLVVHPGATVRLAVAGPPMQLPGLSIEAGGLLDLGTGSLLIASGAATAADVRQWIVAARGTGDWQGRAGLTSSAAGGNRAVASRVRPDGAIEVRVTTLGDANLDQRVDVLDLMAILAGGRYGAASVSDWTTGDFNYDGRTTLVDLTTILAAGGYNTGSISATVATSGSAAVATAPSAAATHIAIPDPTLASTSSFRQLAFRQLALDLAAAQGDEDD